MAIRGPATTQTRGLRVPGLECLEDRRLLSLFVQGTSASVTALRMTGQEIDVASQTPTGAQASIQASVAQNNPTGLSALTQAVATSVSGTEDTLQPGGMVAGVSSLNAATVESSGSSVSSQNQAGPVIQGGFGSSVFGQGQGLASTTAGVSVATALRSPPTLISPKLNAAARSVAEPQYSSAPDDGSVASQAASTENKEATGVRAPVQQGGTALLTATGNNSSGPGGAGPAGATLSTDAPLGASPRFGPPVSTESTLWQAYSSGPASAQDQTPHSILQGRSQTHSEVPSPGNADPSVDGTASLPADEAHSGTRVGVPQPRDLGRAPAPSATANSMWEALSELPQATELLTNFLPCDRATVESAVDAFLEQIVGANTGASGAVDLGRLVPGIAAVAVVTTVSTVMFRRYRRHARNQQSSAYSQAAIDLLACPSNLWKLGEI